MDFSTTFKMIGSAFTAQRAKMDTIVSNLANIHTTRTQEGGPYRRKFVVFAPEPVEGDRDSRLRGVLNGVKVQAIMGDQTPFKQVFDPAHPDANATGFLSVPNVNLITEMADMINANRAYEACVTAFDASKNMALKTLDIGR